MLHKTGPGKIELMWGYSGPGMIRVLLHNFDIDGDEVKTEHRLFLQSRVVPLLQGGRGHLWARGSASRSGPGAHNQQLSKRRIARLAEFLRSFGIANGQMQLDAIGEAHAQAHALEDERDRAVELVVIPVAHQSPSPPRKIPPAPPVNTHFKIRMLGGLGAGAGVFQVENCFFQIADEKNRVTAFYTYSSAGVGKGLIPGLGVSVTMKGPWNPFTTNQAIRVSQFGGPTRFTTAGAGNWTSNHLNMMGLPKGVTTVPAVLGIETGFTVGIGASTSAGELIWVPQEEMIYNGD